MAPQVLEKKIALLFTYRKIVIIFKSVELEHTPSSFPQSKRWSATVQSQKKKRGSSRRIYSCFFTHNGITTPKTTREGQESTTKTRLHLAWPPKVKNQVLFTPRAQNRFLDLGLLLRGCRPKSRSLPGRVEVIHPVVRACTTFWITSTRITLTRVHRHFFATWEPTKLITKIIYKYNYRAEEKRPYQQKKLNFSFGHCTHPTFSTSCSKFHDFTCLACSH